MEDRNAVFVSDEYDVTRYPTLDMLISPLRKASPFGGVLFVLSVSA